MVDRPATCAAVARRVYRLVKERAVGSASRPCEGTYLFVLGLVVIVASADRFWLGFSLALIPILIAAISKAAPTARRPAEVRYRGRAGSRGVPARTETVGPGGGSHQ